MNQRNFIIILVLIAAVLGGWMFYSSQQAVQAESVEDIATKYWKSGHADASSYAFTHWNDEDPAEVPTYCSKCHSNAGFVDFVGADGSEAGKVDKAGKINDPIGCTACHSDEAHALDSVTLPSGVVISGTAKNSVCMTCHSGLTAGSSIDSANADKDQDTPIPDSSMVTAHYYHSASVNQGADGAMGYQYEGKEYVGAFKHATGVETCTSCHDPHSLHIQAIPNSDANLCSTCHSNVTGWADYKKITMSNTDYDGDGVVESAYDEIEGLKAILRDAMNKYSIAITGNGFGFKLDSYPYAFIDTNQDGEIDESEGIFPNQYTTFSPRLLKAVFNFMFVEKEPAAYVHNADYALQLLFDSIDDLSQVSGVTTEGLTRP